MITLWYNGKFYLKENCFAEAILVSDNKIVDVGKTKILLNKKYDKKINLKNKLVLPGFIDSHTHLLNGQITKSFFDLSKINNLKTLIYKSKQFLNNTKNKKLKILKGEKLDYKLFPNLNRFALDKISTSIPIIFRTKDLHTIICNTKALKLSNLFKKNFFFKKKSFIELDNYGFPNGVFKEEAQFLIHNFINDKLKNNFINELTTIAQTANKFGITSVNTCDLIDNNKIEIFNIFKTFTKQNKNLRFFHQYYVSDKKDFLNFLKLDLKDKKMLNQIVSIKLFIDGSLSSRTASLSKKYKDNKKSFKIKFSAKELSELCKLINKYKYPIVSHSIGDKASLEILKEYKKLKNNIRNGIIHLQIATPKIINLLKETKTIVLSQPIFLNEDLLILKNILNSYLIRHSYNFKTLIRNNIHLSFGTDFPVSSLNPWENIYCALFRTSLKEKNNFSTFQENEKLNIFECIDAYTKEGAYASFAEKKLGKISKNYLADFIVLNQNIFKLKNLKNILKTKVMQTVVNGKIVYRK
ncbi:amidohydrolase [Mycoplasmoides pirum]|uniref:amidohydrolase n=1 Tax=Mycoplasmoides pirum TaxID=2122 RepID=UPI000A548115|nr:amidohydrolase family protein [Mycoplasmoides pirum]